MTDGDKEALSALADGETDAATAAALSARWRDDGALREQWHHYQLIGDVLRSDELCGGGADALFVRRLRERLAVEPVVLAPAATRPAAAAVPPRGRRRWMASAAVAAGFLTVMGVMNVVQLPGAPGAAGPRLAAAPQPAMAGGSAALPAPTVVVADALPDRIEPADGVLIRDQRLDQYLDAHQQFGGSSALGVPSGFLRSATYEAPSAALGPR